MNRLFRISTSLCILLLGRTALAVEPCVMIDWAASLDANVGVRALNESYMSVNGTAVVFRLLPNSIVYETNPADGRKKEIASQSRGCFPSAELLIGPNRFDMNYSFVGPRDFRIIGTSSALFTLNKESPGPKQLCSAVKNGGLNEGTGCNTTLNLSLREIDPDAADQVDGMRDQEQRLRAELERLEHDVGHDSSSLRATLDAIAGADLEHMDPSELRRLGDDLARAASLIESLKGDVARLRERYASELKQERAELARIQGEATQSLQIQGISTRDPGLYQEYDLGSFDLPASDIQAIAAYQDAFDPNHNIYLELESRLMQRLQAALAQGNLAEFNLVVATWTNTVGFLATLLEARRATARLAEWQAFNASVGRVRAWLEQNMEPGGFRRGLPLAESTKRAIREEITKYQPEKAAELRDAVNTWTDSKLSPEQELLAQNIEGIGAAYKALDSMNEAGEGLRQARETLSEVLDLTIQAAKLVTRVGIAFTPVGKLVDFCELVTGKELCLPGGKQLTVAERSFSALGLAIGSGQFWRKFGSFAMGRGVAEVAEETVRTVSKVEKLEAFNNVRTGLLHNLAAPGTSGKRVAEFFRSGSYWKTTTTQPIKLYRVFGGKAVARSQWWSTVKPAGPVQAIFDGAIDPAWGNKAIRWIEIEVPAGVSIYGGVSAGIPTAAGGKLLGGGAQIYLAETSMARILEWIEAAVRAGGVHSF